MAKVSIATLDKALPVATPEWLSGTAETRAFFDRERDAIHLHFLRLDAGGTVRIESGPSDRMAYVWEGQVAAGGRQLERHSSLIVEHGASLELAAGGEGAVLLVFGSGHPTAETEGGHVHLLPEEMVPRTGALGGREGMGGALHADATCPTCKVWLHENIFPKNDTVMNAEDGIHSHAEDEVIFVIDGTMRLGQRVFGPGTAISIAADTMYGFTPGADGLAFINFRAGRPTDIKFRNGGAMDEAGFWSTQLGTPAYLEPQPA